MPSFPTSDDHCDDRCDERVSRAGFAAAIGWSVLFFYGGLFAASAVLGLAGAAIEIGTGYSLPSTVVVTVAAALLAVCAGIYAGMFAVGRLRDIGWSPALVVPVAATYCAFVAAAIGLPGVPRAIEGPAFWVLAASLAALVLLPGRGRGQPVAMEDDSGAKGTLYLLVGDRLVRIDE